ncbi:MAG TPA: response regulator transcription factor [Mycobacteriales bacterium]|jgi:DNA-binding response OmpR family regulator|nr:response regulator transcription factor [Mycobacteriales bacterium]
MATGERRILVVDDDADVRSMVRLVLETEGYAVDVAGDGFAALRAVESLAPDCVVLDVMMPGLDGHAVLHRIRGGARSSLPVVMLTASADDDCAWQAWTEGVDYFLAKPFDADELLRYLDYLFHAGSRAS